MNEVKQLSERHFLVYTIINASLSQLRSVNSAPILKISDRFTLVVATTCRRQYDHQASLPPILPSQPKHFKWGAWRVQPVRPVTSAGRTQSRTLLSQRHILYYREVRNSAFCNSEQDSIGLKAGSRGHSTGPVSEIASFLIQPRNQSKCDSLTTYRRFTEDARQGEGTSLIWLRRFILAITRCPGARQFHYSIRRSQRSKVVAFYIDSIREGSKVHHFHITSSPRCHFQIAIITTLNCLNNHNLFTFAIVDASSIPTCPSPLHVAFPSA